ncbi:hypothetical protein [Parabacteroides johnsonii]|jgi:hypothetical protein|uniref:hypothetical protein n=1 Tax=Parabacteroides johnsonii TaxID=387661 RepID=UPI00206378B8|nr:hypothetical protein [Parabacteroides johnsonii]DAI59558.1 MAG TPA: hypothetical protein [Caudoviricetes sp.]
MALCEFCKSKEADKSNTHYLTHSMIKFALNHKGSKDGYKGNIFTIGEGGSIKHTFQQETPPEVIEQAKGRPATDEEIQEAKNDRTFSVDNVFCSECEKRFGVIENKFTQEVLPKIKSSTESEIAIEDNVTIRLFFLLQVWRSSVCDPDFTLPPLTKEAMRKVLWEGSNVKDWKIKKFPLSITYLRTDKDEEKTSNIVSTDSKEYWPRVIFMGEFVIQFHQLPPVYDSLFGINDRKSYSRYINHNESKFIVQILDDSKRKEINYKIYNQGVNITINDATDIFIATWKEKVQQHLSDEIVNNFKLQYCQMERYSPEELTDLINRIIEKNTITVDKTIKQ